MTKQAFYTRLTLFTLALAGILFLIQSKYDISQLIWGALAYFALLTMAVYVISQSGLKKDNKTFITRTYGAIGIRFLFSLFPLIIYFIFSPQKQLSFAFAYMFLYFFYTSFEIYCLVVNLRPDSNKPTE